MTEEQVARRRAFEAWRDSHECAGSADHYAWMAWKAAQTIPAGWQLVPIEPTPEMLARGRPEHSPYGTEYAEACYRAMLAAAPKPEGGA